MTELYDHASGVRSILVIVVMFLTVGIAYQSLVSKAQANDKQSQINEKKNEKQDVQIAALIALTQKLVTQQTVTNFALEENSRQLNKLIDGQDNAVERIIEGINERRIE